MPHARAHLHILCVAVLAACGQPDARARAMDSSCQPEPLATPLLASPFGDSIRLPASASVRSALALGDSIVVQFAQADGQINAFSLDGEPLWTFGRSGDGPGEIARPFSTLVIGGVHPDWISTEDDRVVVFDGRSVFLLSNAGALLERWDLRDRLGNVLRTSRRLRAHQGALYLDLTDGLPRNQGAVDVERRFRLMRITRDSATEVIGMSLAALPRSAGGTVVDGPAQAKPLWDLAGHCIVLSDGHSPRLVVGDLAASRWDTLVLALPDEFASAEDAAAAMKGLTTASAGEVAPSALARITELTLAPSGTLWLQPAGRAARLGESVLAWRYELAAGRLSSDTLTQFPRAVTRSGEAYGISVDDEGLVALVKARRPQ